MTGTVEGECEGERGRSRRRHGGRRGGISRRVEKGNTYDDK